jgi:hypothetical protein
MTGRRRAAVGLLVITAIWGLAWPSDGRTDERDVRREDHGGLVVLHLAGSYREMGRQAATLLGEDARVAAQLYRRRWRRLVRDRGATGWLEDRILPGFWSLTGRWWDSSQLFRELAGMGEVLHAGPTDMVRGFYGGLFGGGSTAFVATGRATVNGSVILGRNVDWSDDRGVRRPVVTYYHPTNGDLDHLAVGWAANPLPIVGMNTAGLVVSLNFFEADDVIAFGVPEIIYRRVLQRARTVEEAADILTSARSRGGATLMVLADAGARFAIWECLPARCERFDPGEEWAGLSNHARTPTMIAHDRGRVPDSFRRLAAIEAAVERHLGRVDPLVAATILRDRSNGAYANDSTVGNLRVLNSLVVDPTARTLWHATSLQPEAPFGEMVPFVLGEGAAPEVLPPAARWLDGRLARERPVIAALRQASRLCEDGDLMGAGAIYERLAAVDDGIVDPMRLRWARARVRFAGGDLAGAAALLAPLADPAAPFDVQVFGLATLGLIRDRLGDRPGALAAYERADAVLAARPESSEATFFAQVRRWIDAGLRRPQRGPMPETPGLQMVSP